MASNNTKKLGLTNLRGKLKKKGADTDSSQELLNSPSTDMPSSNYSSVYKSASTSSIPGNIRKSLGTATDSSVSSSSLAIDTQHMDQDTVLALTHDVRTFSDSLSKLHNTVHKREETGQQLKVAAHEKLGEVLSILKTILKRYPPVNSTDLLTATGVLISKVKGCDYEDAGFNFTDLFEAIDQLALSFSSSVSEFLMGDMETSFNLPPASSNQSLESSMSSATMRYKDTQRELLSAAKMDAQLQQMESGVELALERAKVWSKYAKDVITYIEKRTSLENEFARGLGKLVQTTKPAIMENSFLPFQSIFCTALDQDKDFANTTQAVCAIVLNQKFVEPLSQRRAEHEKARKLLRDEWSKEVRKMNDAITNLKKAKILYYQRCVDYEKAKESTARLESDALSSSTGLAQHKQIEKKKKMSDEAFMKANEAETTYKACVIEANHRQTELERAKGLILSQVRELITLCERTMKAATIAYFQLQHTVTAPAPVQFQTLCENCRSYEPGMQYSEFVRRLPSDETVQHESFSFEPYQSEELKARKVSGTGQLDSLTSSKNKLTVDKLGSESESLSSGGNKSGDNSPTASPYSGKKVYTNSSSNTGALPQQLSISALSAIKDGEKIAGHIFKRLRTPSKCRVCDSYVYFNGMECEQCGISCHKKCLFTLSVQCGSSQNERRMTTFGVSFDDHIQKMNVEVPVIVTKCIEEIDRRGLDIRGIYRVSGVKSKVEKLCQSFETGGDIDLSEHHPNVISNVLKLYLRQLPEPLMTVNLYGDFIEVAREQSTNKITDEQVISRLRSIIDQLPAANFKTAAQIIHHLKRVSQYESENQMNPSNLGIVFGPTLLRPSEGPVNLNSLIDTAHQTRAVELLITYSTELFGADSVKLERQPSVSAISEEGSDQDNESISSEGSSSANRLNSLDSNLADEIMTALHHPSKSPGVQGSDEHLEVIRESGPSATTPPPDDLSLDSDSDDSAHDSTDDSKLSSGPTGPPSGAQQVSVYHTQVMRSASMPFPGLNRKVEKSASTEFRFKVPIESQALAGNDRKPTYIISAAPATSTNQGRPSNQPTPTYPITTNNNPLFYKPAYNKTSYLSLPLSNTNSSNNSQQPYSTGSGNSGAGSYLLPDIGAPDVTEELYNSERRLSADSNRSTGSQRAQHWDSNSELTATSDSVPSRATNAGKAVFYTHSMKKKSTEPKFV